MRYLITCPCCDQLYETNKPVAVSLDTNSLTYRGKKIRLTGRQAEFAYMLSLNMPNVVLYETIIKGFWPSGHDPLTANTSLHVYANKLRKKLGHAGLTIVAVRNRGYSLIELFPVRTERVRHAKPNSSPYAKEVRGIWTTQKNVSTLLTQQYQAQLTLYGLPNCLGMQVNYSPEAKEAKLAMA
jgi:DNA-binding winged helix-turn-helix (wHTH) protein